MHRAQRLARQVVLLAVLQEERRLAEGGVALPVPEVFEYDPAREQQIEGRHQGQVCRPEALPHYHHAGPVRDADVGHGQCQGRRKVLYDSLAGGRIESPDHDGQQHDARGARTGGEPKCHCKEARHQEQHPQVRGPGRARYEGPSLVAGVVYLVDLLSEISFTLVALT